MNTIIQIYKGIVAKGLTINNYFQTLFGTVISSVARFYTTRKKFAIGLSLALIVVVVGGILLWQNHTARVHHDQQEVALKNIFALAQLPVDEDPASSTVKDLEAVKGSEFFKDAQVGDVILFFKKARKAGLLRPSTSKIINSALVVGEIPPQFKALAGDSVAVQAVNIAVFNGTKVAGFEDKEAQLLMQEYKTDINVVYKDTARNTATKITTVVDLSGENAGLANALSVTLGGVKGDFPPGEKLPGAMKDFPEILVFLGASSVK
jgi:hypothetical protein